MSQLISATARCKCTMGVAPTPLNVIPGNIMIKTPVAKITDSQPITNIPSFGMCSNKTNPAVISIIASSLGSVQVAPCIPLPTPWVNPSKLLINNVPPLTNEGKKFCYPGGIITVQANQFTINIK